MFQKLVALDVESHRDLRFKPNQPYDYAAEMIMTPVTASEMNKVAREMPIVFPQKEPGLPQALLGYEPGRNIHVDESGRWLGRYIPAHIRRYPFIINEVPQEGPSGSKRRYAVFIDIAARHFNDANDGHRLFTEQGNPDEMLKRVQDFLGHLQQDGERAKALVGQLEHYGLLEERALRLDPKKEDGRALTGFRVINQAAVSKLKAETLAELRTSGALAMIYTHFVSLSNLDDGWLAKTVRAESAADDSGEALPFSIDDIDWSKF